MFRLYDHLQTEIYASDINTTDNGYSVFFILVNLIDDSDGFLVTVDMAAVAKLTIANCCWTYLAQSMFLVWVVSWILLIQVCRCMLCCQMCFIVVYIFVYVYLLVWGNCLQRCSVFLESCVSGVISPESCNHCNLACFLCRTMVLTFPQFIIT
jgi:hypothetical protein